MTRSIVFGLFAAFIAFSPATAQNGPATDPVEFVRTLGDDTIDVMRTTDTKVRRERFQVVLDQGFAVDTIARFVIGRYWRAANDEQRREYMRLFRNFVLLTYAARLDGYAGQTFKLTGSVRIDDKDTLVKTIIRQPDKPPIRADYRVRKTNDGLKIIDVMVEGVSLVTTQRSEFASIINRDGIDGLLERLRGYGKKPITQNN